MLSGIRLIHQPSTRRANRRAVQHDMAHKSAIPRCARLGRARPPQTPPRPLSSGSTGAALLRPYHLDYPSRSARIQEAEHRIQHPENRTLVRVRGDDQPKSEASPFGSYLSRAPQRTNVLSFHHDPPRHGTSHLSGGTSFSRCALPAGYCQYRLVVTSHTLPAMSSAPQAAAPARRLPTGKGPSSRSWPKSARSAVGASSPHG